MNARISLPGARMAPVALAAGIALALGLSAPVQAQYTYPGTASAAPRAAQAKPARADQFKRPAHSSTDPLQNCPPGQGPCGGKTTGGMGGTTGEAGPKKTGTAGYSAYRQANAVRPAAGAAIQATAYGSPNPTRHRNTNPSMQPGEACPPGSHCAPHGSSQQTPAGSPARSGAYGAHESYGYATSPTSAHQAASRNASVSPVRAGARGALNYGPSQTSNTNFRNSVTGKASGPSVNVTGQQTSFMGPNGKKVSMDGSQTITGPNGQKQTIGSGPDLNNIGGGYGHQKGSGLKQGMSYSADGNGSMSGTRTGSAPGMASAGGMNMGNGGVAGTESGSHMPSSGTQSGGHSDADSHTSRDWFYDHGIADHPTNGTDDKGNVWQHDVVWTGTDSNGARFKDGKQVGGKVLTADQQKDRNNTITAHPGKEMPADMGPDAGPGEIVSGTGQVVQPGKKKGQDTGGGQTGDAGTTNSGGQNAQGQYIAPSGQDAPVKPKEAGALKMDFNGKNGAIDPKLNGGAGGGG